MLNKKIIIWTWKLFRKLFIFSLSSRRTRMKICIKLLVGNIRYESFFLYMLRRANSFPLGHSIWTMMEKIYLTSGFDAVNHAKHPTISHIVPGSFTSISELHLQQCVNTLHIVQHNLHKCCSTCDWLIHLNEFKPVLSSPESLYEI